MHAAAAQPFAMHACLAQVDIHTVTLDLQDIAKVEALIDGLPDAFQEVGTRCMLLLGTNGEHGHGWQLWLKCMSCAQTGRHPGEQCR